MQSNCHSLLIHPKHMLELLIWKCHSSASIKRQLNQFSQLASICSSHPYTKTFEELRIGLIDYLNPQAVTTVDPVVNVSVRQPASQSKPPIRCYNCGKI